MARIPLNPFDASPSYSEKKPQNMSLEELRMYLHIQRLGIQLKVQQVKSRIGYFRAILETIKELELAEKIDKWVMAYLQKQTEETPGE